MKELQLKPLRKWEFYSRKETCERALSDIMLVELEKVNTAVNQENDITFDLQFWKR